MIDGHAGSCASATVLGASEEGWELRLSRDGRDHELPLRGEPSEQAIRAAATFLLDPGKLPSDPELMRYLPELRI